MIRGAFRSAPAASALFWLPLFSFSTGFAQDENERELRLDATEKFEYRRLHQDDEREDAFRNRMEVAGYYGIFSAWVRLESLQLSDATVYDPYGAGNTTTVEEQRIDETKVTKRLFTAETDRFRVQAGDVSHVFGRGLALSVFEEEELNFDTRLEGVLAEIENDFGTAAAIAGSNEGNRFRGVFAETAPRELPVHETKGRIGASFVEAWGGTVETNIRPREQHAGGFAELVIGPATLYGEGLARTFPGKDGEGKLGKPGHGAFVSGQVTARQVTVSAEHRDYFRFEHKFNDPPTTLRQHAWTSLNRVNGQVLNDVNDDDANGTLAQVEWAPGPFSHVQASWSRLDRDEDSDEFTELYGEGKTTWKERVFVTAALAESELDIATTLEERITTLGELVVELDDVNSLSTIVEWAEVKKSDELTAPFEFPNRFHERIFALSWGRSPWLTVTATYEDTGLRALSEERDDWANLIAEVAVAEGHDVVLSYGSERGGWKCTGGVCFFEPEFEGLKVKWVGRF